MHFSTCSRTCAAGPASVLLGDMNTKVTIGIIVIIVIIAGLFFIFKGAAGAPTSSGSTASSTSANSSDQVQGQDVTVGTGASAEPGDSVSVLYVGYIGQISSTTVFDSSAAHGNQPLVFTLGSNGLIPGFQIGVNGMKVGGERLLAIPSSLGYGAQAVTGSNGQVIIPANSTLIFDVKLVDVAPGTSTPSTSGTGATQ